MKSKTKYRRFIQFLQKLNRFGSLRPVSSVFGGDRGKPIDRFYIEDFLNQNIHNIKGKVLEVAGNSYTRNFGGSKVEESWTLHLTCEEKKPKSIIGNLETGEGITDNEFDCFIMTQTLLCIFDIQAAARNAIKLLRPGGVLLLTVPGISQISRYDYDRWGHYWSFTDQSVRRLFEKIVPRENIEVKTYGNVKATTAFLYGLAHHEVKREHLVFFDGDYQMIISAVIKK
jgi:SAM-dependent methyltransferase